MTVLTEGKHTGEHLVSEANKTRSREVVTLISGQDLVAGTVLGRITASGKYTQFNQDGVDGSENAAAVLFDNVDASAGDTDAVVHIRDCEVNGAELTWPGDIEPAEQTAAEAQLVALGIIVR
jgi:hypothetical protein